MSPGVRRFPLADGKGRCHLNAPRQSIATHQPTALYSLISARTASRGAVSGSSSPVTVLLKRTMWWTTSPDSRHSRVNSSHTVLPAADGGVRNMESLVVTHRRIGLWHRVLSNTEYLFFRAMDEGPNIVRVHLSTLKLRSKPCYLEVHMDHDIECIRPWWRNLARERYTNIQINVCCVYVRVCVCVCLCVC